jgi:membrane protease YdiL (CAAX protease family)
VLDGVACLAGFYAIHGFVALLLAVRGAGRAGPVLAMPPTVAFCSLLIWVLVRRRGGAGTRPSQLVGLVLPRGRILKRIRLVLAVGVTANVLVFLVTMFVVQRLGSEPEPQPMTRYIRSAPPAAMFAVACLVTVGVVPFMEEVLFRSLLYLPLRARLGPVAAALIVSGVFATLHFYPAGTAQFFALSLTFIWLFECTGSLWAAVLAHALFNAVNIVLMMASVAPPA